MTISLDAVRLKLQRRLLVLDSGFERHLVEPTAVHRVDKYALQEGYVSALWQVWCSFCREVLIRSVQGAATSSGSITTSPHSALSEMEIAYVARELSQRRRVNRIRPLVGNHQEHTWGDLGKMTLIANGIGCSNVNSIHTGLSACRRVSDLQLCRNASAHISKSTIQNVKNSRVRYQDSHFEHPSDMIRWVDPDTSDFLWKSWTSEIELAADLSVL